MECPNVHIISPQAVAHGLLHKWVFTHSYRASWTNSNMGLRTGCYRFGIVVISIKEKMFCVLFVVSLFSAKRTSSKSTNCIIFASASIYRNKYRKFIMFLIFYICSNLFSSLNSLLMGLRICWLYPLQRGKTLPTSPHKVCSGYGTKMHPVGKLQFWKPYICLKKKTVSSISYPKRSLSASKTNQPTNQPTHLFQSQSIVEMYDYDKSTFLNYSVA